MKDRIEDNRTREQRDVWKIVAATIAFAVFSMFLNLGETWIELMRSHEGYQIDEVPGVLLFAALALVWYAHRRIVETRDELGRRIVAEKERGDALAANQRLAREIVRIQEDERRSLARELHDELGQYLNAIKVDAVAIRAADAGRSPDIHRAAVSIIGIADHVQATVRNTVARLRPAGLDELGLVAALEHCVDGWRERMPNVHFALSAPEDGGVWDEAVNITLYRVVQEGLTNVAKHSGATQVEIHLEAVVGEANGEESVVLTVWDDGIGAAVSGNQTGLGLVGMRERVEALGGRFEAEGTGAGFRLRAVLPVRGTSGRER